jgi:hypothetical protein
MSDLCKYCGLKSEYCDEFTYCPQYDCKTIEGCVNKPECECLLRRYIEKNNLSQLDALVSEYTKQGKRISKIHKHFSMFEILLSYCEHNPGYWPSGLEELGRVARRYKEGGDDVKMAIKDGLIDDDIDYDQEKLTKLIRKNYGSMDTDLNALKNTDVWKIYLIFKKHGQDDVF